MTPTPVHQAGPVISAWSAVSAFGIGRDEFSAGLHAGRRTVAPLDRERWPAPVHDACLVPDFTIKDVLGRKGTRSMDRATALAVTAVGDLLTNRDDDSSSPSVAEDTALVLATTTGSAQSIMDFTRDSLVGERPFFVDPARFPNTVMNCAAGQSAIWHQLCGPNTTIAAGRASGLMALKYGLRLQRAGHAPTVLCGAVEEFSSARAWLEWHCREPGATPMVIGEGCVVLLLEPAASPEDQGRRGPLAEVLAVECNVYHDDNEIGEVLADCVRRAMDEASVAAGEMWAVAPSRPAGAAPQAEDAALNEVLDIEALRVVDVAQLLGDTSAASATFQIASLLAAAEHEPAAAGRVALVSSVDRDGVVGCALLRITGPQT